MNNQVPVKRPVVAKPPRQTGLAGPATGLGMIGLAVFFWLSEARASMEESENSLPALVTPSMPAPAEAPPVATAQATPPPTSSFFVPNSGPVTLVPSAQPRPYTPGNGLAPLPPPPQAPSAAAENARERLRAPALVVDFAQAEQPRQPGSSNGESQSSGGRTITVAPPSIATAQASDPSRSDIDRFASRVGSEEVGLAEARRLVGLDRLVPQGAIIGAVMETALNSDVPGYARAITQRDVYSFDGSTVLIPAGSRLIGQYKSGIAQGGSRVFVLWTRLIRSDGVSIDLASPAVDELGRGGLGGKVNRHFLQRFGGAILTSVLTAGVSAAAAAASGGSTIIVGNAGQATSLAGQAVQNGDIPPTITTRQGAGVRVFVARDLDFSKVGPAQ